MKLEAIRGELEDRVERQMETLKVPGVVVGVRSGADELIAAFGVTNVDHPLDVTDSTLFQIGSTTKTFTATALMRKVEDGALDLDAPLQTYLPDFSLEREEWAKRVTPRHLLTHTGGWDGDYLLANPAGGRGDDALQRVVEAMPRVPVLTPPGTLYHYNNTGFSLAGRLLEVLTEATYEDSIRELVFEPLGLESSLFLPEQVITRRFAVGHTHTSPTEIAVAEEWALHRSSSAAGAISAHVHDQLRYASFHLGDGKTPGGERILEAETLARMQSPQVEIGENSEAVGISWLLGRVAGTRTVAHGGGTNGQISTFQMIPERDFALIILTNADTGAALNGRLARWLHARVLDLNESDPEPLELSREALREYVGTYEREMITLEVRGRGEGLEVDAVLQKPPKGWEARLKPPPTGIDFYSPDRVIAQDGLLKGARGSFVRGGDGAIEWLRWGGRIHRRRE